MIDVGEKPVVLREAETFGKIQLSGRAVDAIRSKSVRKGDPFAVGEVAAMQAAKQTAQLIPHCHQVPLDQVEARFELKEDGVEVVCRVRARGRTGVEMEALVGVAAALNTVWDMVKYLEKDPEGQYPETRISDIRVVRKRKGA
jgi:cyclic pyranopterin phosphate synthase